MRIFLMAVLDGLTVLIVLGLLGRGIWWGFNEGFWGGLSVIVLLLLLGWRMREIFK